MLLEARRTRRRARSRKRACWGSSAAIRGWRLRTQSGIAEADFCIVATGARNPLREVGTEWSAKDTMSALGYYVPATQEQIDIQFLPRPRRLHLGVSALRASFGGHLRQGRTGAGVARAPGSLHGRARHRVEGIARFTATCCRRSKRPAGGGNRVAGEGWLAVGDAAGLVDPITGEGSYYAMRSGDLASRVLIDDAHVDRGKSGGLSRAAGARVRARSGIRRNARQACLPGSFMFNSVPARMIQFHAPQPALPRLDAGSVRRNAAVLDAQEPPAAQPERHASGSTHELLPESRDSRKLARQSMNIAKSEELV